MNGHVKESARSHSPVQRARARASRPVPSLPVPSVGNLRRSEVIRRSRTSPQEPRRALHDGNPRLRLIAKVVRQLVTAERFTTFADLKYALRLRLGVLRIPYQQHEFDDACSLVASNQRIVHLPAPPVCHVEHSADARPLTRAEASAFMAQLPGLIKALPATTGAQK